MDAVPTPEQTIQNLVRKAIRESPFKNAIFAPNERDSVKDTNVKLGLGEIYGKE